jgi:hypothetical protein
MSDDWAQGQCHAAVWPEVLEALRKAHVVGKSSSYLKRRESGARAGSYAMGGTAE